MAKTIYQTGHGRVFVQWGGAGPFNEAEYQGTARMGGIDLSQGDPTSVEVPSDYQIDEFEEVDEIKGERSRPTTSLIARFGNINKILTSNCPLTIQAHYGKCSNPLLFNEGWETIVAFTNAIFTSRSSDDMTAFESSGRAPITITGDLSGRRFWEIHQLTLAELAAAQVDREVVDIVLFDFVSCGDCGYESSGEQRYLMVTKGSGAGSPGLPAELLITSDTGATLSQYDIDTLATSEDPSGLAVVGKYVVVISADSQSAHYAEFDSPDSWAEVATGFTTAPNAIHSLSPTMTWVVGDSGYVYLMTSPGAGVEARSTGSASSENLTCVDALNEEYALAGGENGALILTTNRGVSWAAAQSSPTVATINVVRMRKQGEWVVGDANGYIYATKDSGANWSTVAHPLSGQGEVFDLDFCRDDTSPFGFMVAADGDGDGYMFRTLDGGNTWYQLPDFPTSTPANAGLKALAVGITGNVAMAGGVKDDSDGVVVVAS